MNIGELKCLRLPSMQVEPRYAPADQFGLDQGIVLGFDGDQIFSVSQFVNMLMENISR
jgi:hypothetical protein